MPHSQVATAARQPSQPDSLFLGCPRDIFRKMIVQGLIICSLHLWITQRWDWIEGWIFAVSSFVCFVSSHILAEWANPGLLRERDNVFHHANAQPYDKVMAPLMAIGILLLPVVSALEWAYLSSWQDTKSYSCSAKLVAAAFILFGFFFSTHAMIANPFFSAIMRIQDDRGFRHKVVVTGPYGWVRHPAYSSVLSIALGTPIFLDSVLAFIPAVTLIVVTFLRTRLEDEALQRDLKGYQEYAQRVTYRLIPFVW